MKNANKSMEVKILNPQEVLRLYEAHGHFARICYNSPEKSAKAIGRHCQNAGHMSGSRTRYIEMHLTNIPRSLADQFVRHEIGVIKNMRSMRYCKEDDFEYYTGTKIQKNSKALEIYQRNMNQTQKDYDEIVELLLSDEYTEEQACEEARGILGMDTHTQLAIGFTIEALEHFMHKRLCLRSQEPIRILANLIRDEVLKLLPDLKNRLVPHCKYLTWCPEGKQSCGVIPTKEEIEELIRIGKEQQKIK